MKNILVLTDFSDNATTAAETGLIIAGKMSADILLFNTYINYQSIASYGGGGWIVDEFTERKHKSKLGLQALTEGLESLSYQLDTGDRKPAINSESDDNDLGLDVAELIKTKNVELVVMGARSGNKESFMFGADTNAVIEYSTRPVLIVPSGADIKKIHKIILATDFQDADMKAIHYLAKLGNLLHCQLEIIHVRGSGSECDKNKKAFEDQLSAIKYTGLKYHEVNGKEVVNRLNRLVNEETGSMLAMVHIQNSFFIRLFQHSMVRKALVHQNTPLLIFPSKMD
jgi:nucleotide-binding universal stress UspA family protein